MWRPEGYKNPYEDYFGKLKREMALKEDYETNQHFAYEAGFDACLEALKKEEIKLHLVTEDGGDYPITYSENGILVFVPEDKDA